MAANIKNLGDGQLPAVKASLYAVPPSTQTVVLAIILVNTDVAARTVNIYYKKSGGTSRLISGQAQSIAAGEKAVLVERFTMSAGDVIEGDASVAAVVDYTISGVENGAAAVVPTGDDWDTALYSERDIGVTTTGTVEEVLGSVTIPANTLNADYAGVDVLATFSAAANVNNKTVRLRVGGLAGTLVAEILNDATSGNRFQLRVTLMVNGSGSMDGAGAYTRTTGTSGVYGVPTLTGLTFSGTIDIVATGLTGTSAGDVTLTSMRVVLLRRVV